MFRHVRQLPRLDLASRHVVSLSLNLVTAWDEDLADDFGWGDLVAGLFGVGGDDEEDLPLVVPYRRHKVKYVISLVGSPALEHTVRLTITVRYAPVPPTMSGCRAFSPI